MTAFYFSLRIPRVLSLSSRSPSLACYFFFPLFLCLSISQSLATTSQMSNDRVAQSTMADCEVSYLCCDFSNQNIELPGFQVEANSRQCEAAVKRGKNARVSSEEAKLSRIPIFRGLFEFLLLFV